MIRLALCLLILGGTTAMAAPLETPDYNPYHQVPTPDGTVRDQDAPPSDKEMMLWMWHRFAGDKPIPEELQKKYGLPAQPPPLPAGR